MYTLARIISNVLLCVCFFMASSIIAHAAMQGNISGAVGTVIILDPAGDMWLGGDNSVPSLLQTGKKYLSTLAKADSNVSFFDSGGLHVAKVKKTNVFFSGHKNRFPGQLAKATGTSTNWQWPKVHGVQSCLGNDSYSLVLKNDGTVWTCGFDVRQLGRPASETLQAAWEDSYRGISRDVFSEAAQLVQVESLHNIVQVYLGNYFSLALQDNGDLWFWGEMNGFDAAQAAQKITALVPQRVFSGVKVAGAAGDLAFAVKHDGSLWVWGSGFRGYIGERHIKEELLESPLQVLDNVVTAVSNDSSGVVVLRNDDSLWTWGLHADCSLPITNLGDACIAEGSEGGQGGWSIAMSKVQQGLGFFPLSPGVYYRAKDDSFWVNLRANDSGSAEVQCVFKQVLIKQGNEYKPVKEALKIPPVSGNHPRAIIR